MSLKIWANGSMKKINTNLHKPMIFLNGTKYKLDKAYTFINGEKFELWGEGGVQVDYISSTDITGNVFAAGEDWAVASSSGNILRLDISNLSSPTTTQSVNWGNVVMHNGFLSSVSNSVFFTTLNSHTHHKLLVTPTGNVTVDKTLTSSSDATYIRGFTDNYVFGTRRLNQYVSSQTGHGTGKIIHYGDNYYWNTSLRYSAGAYPSPQQQYTSGGLQIDANNIVANISNSGFNKASYTDLTFVRSAALTGIDLLDGNIICGTVSLMPAGYIAQILNNFALTDKTSFTQLYIYPNVADTSIQYRFLGRNGDYYYLIQMPAGAVSTAGNVKLLLLDSSDLSLVYEKDLPRDPFGENNGNLDFWGYGGVFPQVSNTGFLTFYGVSTNGLRFARFSALI